MPINKEEARHIAALAKLNLKPEELENITLQLNDILTYMEKLNMLDTENIQPLSHPLENTNVFRIDEKQISVSKEEALKNSPDQDGNYFVVPKIISGEK